jgi:hypothetical protein
MNIDETVYLLKSSENASRLMQGIKDYENGLGKEQSLIESDESKSKKLDLLTKEDYQKEFKKKAKTKKYL